MGWSGFRQRLRALLRCGATESELYEELSAHLEFQFRKHLVAGMCEEEARRLAHIEFGGVENVREECREIDRWRWIDASARCLKHCFRSLTRSPGFALISILLLAVGIGANVAVFSTVDTVFLRPLPVKNPEALSEISLVGNKGDLLEMPSTALDVLRGDSTLTGVCGFATSLQSVEIDRNMRSIGLAALSGDCFQTLGIRLELGRSITAADNHLGTAGIAVITDSLWRNTFGGRADILGQPLKIRGQLYTIVGVTEKGFAGLALGFPEDIMIPLLQRPLVLPDGSKPVWYWVSVLARRAPGVSQAQLRASVLSLRQRILQMSVPHHYNAAERRDYLSRKVAVTSGKNGVDYWLRNRFGEPLYPVFGLCAAMLLIACVNLTSLFLARGLNRRREIAIRLALGGGRMHIVGLFVLENAILVVVGAVCGSVAGLWTARWILSHGGAMFGNFRLDVGFDARVIAFLVGVAVLILAGFAMAWLWQARRLSNPGALKESGRGLVASNNFAQKWLIGAQIALTLAFVTEARC